MNKIFGIALALLFASFITVTCSPAMACSKNAQNITGAACSIKELNEMTQQKTVQTRSGQWGIKEERDLRPVKIKDANKFLNQDCFYKWCFPKGSLRMDY